MRLASFIIQGTTNSQRRSKMCIGYLELNTLLVPQMGTCQTSCVQQEHGKDAKLNAWRILQRRG